MLRNKMSVTYCDVERATQISCNLSFKLFKSSTSDWFADLEWLCKAAKSKAFQSHDPAGHCESVSAALSPEVCVPCVALNGRCAPHARHDLPFT